MTAPSTARSAASSTVRVASERLAPPERARTIKPLSGPHELLLMVAAWLVYFGVRAVSEGRASVARAHAREVLRLEHRLGVAWERAVQQPVLDHHWLLDAANWMYVWGHWPVIAISGFWLYRQRPAAYRELRTAFLVSGAIGIVIFAMFPVAPPRLAGLGLVDSVTHYSHAYRALQPRELTNIYAAFPSLHFGWDLLVGLALVRYGPTWLVGVAGALAPIAMALAVVATANHFVLDVVGGGAVALTGLVVARRLLQDRAYSSG